VKSPFTKFPRQTCLFFSIACFAIAAWYAQHTLWLAETKHPESIGYLNLFGFLICLGLTFLGFAIFPQQALAFTKGLRQRKKTVKDMIVIAAVVLPGLAGYAWMVWKLKELGYESL
jgi:hypothetical protein